MPTKQLPQVHMRRHPETGWIFTINFPDREAAKLYRTNSEGKGLWIRQKSQPITAPLLTGHNVYDWHILLNTTAFFLPAARPAAYQKIRRAFARPQVKS